MKPLLFALVFLFPAAARADLVYKCRSDGPATDLSANLRFDDKGRGGRIELERWAGYPPTPLVYADLRGPVSRDGRAVYTSLADANFGARAEIALPLNFLKEDYFSAEITVTEAAGRATKLAFGCERF